MKIAEVLLSKLSEPIVRKKVDSLDKSEKDRGINYAEMQFNRYLSRGFRHEIKDKTILEIGCGHGGISVFLALNGAKKVYGIDLNEKNMAFGEELKALIQKRLNATYIPVYFQIENVINTSFEDDTFDIIIADNVFEHFDDNIKVLKECKRILKEGGKLIVPSMPPIYSRNGTHLKNGIGVKWVNVFFSERTILNVLKKNCEKYPVLNQIYPGIKDNPLTIRDVRRHKDLNYITNKKFKNQVLESGLKIKDFQSKYIYNILRLVLKPFPKFSIIHDFFSVTTSAVIVKRD